MRTIQKSEVPRIAYLDGLRGVAALMVLMAHLMISLFPAVVTFSPAEVHTAWDIPLGLSPLAVLWTGNFAVCIFFVLSGFVLSDFCQRTRLSFPAQLARRYCRLAVPMLLTSTFAWFLLHFGLYKNVVAAERVTHSGWLATWYNFHPNFFNMALEALLRAFVQGHARYNCNLWTMQIEIIGSFYIFALFMLFKNRYLRLIALLCFLGSGFHGYYLMFAVGALLYDFHPEWSAFRQRMPFMPLQRLFILLVFITALYLGAYPNTPPSLVSPWYVGLKKLSPLSSYMAGAVLLVTCILQSPALQLILSSKPCKFLGKISFVLYLIHIPIICSYSAWVAYLTRALPYNLTALLTAATTVIVVLFVSHILYRYLDQYTTEWSRRLGDWLDERISFAELPVKNASRLETAEGYLS